MVSGSNHMLKKILIALAAALLILVVVVATRPADFTISRKATVGAPPAVVFPHLNDFRKWNAWSPWVKLDPEAKFTFDGPDAGEGAKYAWSGNNQIGAGVGEIVESVPDEKVRVKLMFEKPFEATSEAQFDLRPEGAGTEVTWTMTGKNDFIGKAFALFMDVDEMAGTDFEEGLANLNKILTSDPAPEAEPKSDTTPE